jgi:signal transduction histidine kinase
MKFLSKISLQWRVTILTAIILSICFISITLFSMYNAQLMLSSVLEENSVNTSQSGIVTSGINGADGTEIIVAPAKLRKQQFDVKSVIFCIIITIAGIGAVYFVSGKALKPVKLLSDKVAQIDENNLSGRLPEVTTKDEIGRLTIGFNHMLDRLEEAFKRQKQFTASAAHELKTPLATLKAGMQVLKRDNNATLQDYEENADILIKSVDRLTGVVNDLLLIASAEESKQEIQEEIYLDAMFETIFDELSSLYDKQNIIYKIELSEKIIYGNSSMLYRTFYNLIENAYKYNRTNGEISVTAYEENDSVVIRISDTGKGIPEEHLPYIFEAFYRVDASRSRKIAGAGLGLSLVKTIIERHGGHISVESSYGKGSVFTIELPN